MQKDKLKILYFGIYDPNYVRNWVLINGLRRNGVEVFECREKPGKLGLMKLALKYLCSRERFDAMVVGFPGQEVMFLAKLLIMLRPSLERAKPIIFDTFTSHYGGYILDRRKAGKNSWRARYFRFLDKWSCKLADLCLLDTNAHINFFVGEYGLPRGKFKRILIGANDEIYKPLQQTRDKPFDGGRGESGRFKVLFFGTYVPQHGIEYIIGAAKILEGNKDIVFCFVGKGQDKPKSLDLVKKLGLNNIEFIDMISPEDLKLKIAESDVVLGTFGTTPKTPIVIPIKIYESLAMNKAVITNDSPAMRELFDENDLFMVRAGDSAAIAEAILKLKSDSGLADRLAENGHIKFLKFAMPEALGRELKTEIERLLS